MSRVTRYWRHRLQGERPWDLEMIGLAVAALGWQVDPAPQRQLQSLFLPQEMSSASRYSGPFVRGSRGRRFLPAYIFSGVEQPLVREGWPRNEPRGHHRRLFRFDLGTKACLLETEDAHSNPSR